MTDRWTKGPWRVDESGFGQVGGFTISDEKNGFGLCQRAAWPNRAEESAANARLIAEAPALVEALDGLLDALAMGPLDLAAKYGPDAHPDEAVVDAAHNAAAVLARIRGEAGKEQG